MIIVNKISFYSVAVGILLLIISIITDEIFHLLGVFVSFYFIWKAKIEHIIGLFLLYFLKSNFFSPSLQIISNNINGDLDFIESSAGFVIGGFPLNVATLSCAFISLRVFYEILFCPITFKNKVPNYLLYLWLISFIPALIAFVWSYQLGNPNWTRGLRFLMISGSYFYGFIFVKNLKNNDKEHVLKIFFPFITLMIVLTYINVFWSHLSFLFVGFAGAFSFYYYFKRGVYNKFTGLLLVFLILSIGFTSTLTLFSIAFLSCFFSFIINKPKRRHIYNKIINGSSKYMIPLSIIFTFSIAYLGYYFDLSLLADPNLETNFSDRFIFKTLADRLPFWFAALEQIIEGPYFYVPSGRPFYINSLYYGANFEWIVGAHNVYLETLRNTGLIVGSVIILICLTAIKNNFKVLKYSSNKTLQSLSIIVITVGLVGMTVGDFPIDMTVGFFLWSIAGFNYGLFLKSKTLNH